MHYMLVVSITVPLHPACKTCNYIHYMLNYMLPMMLMCMCWYIRVCNCSYQYILECTSTYQHVLHVYTSMYWFVSVHAGMYEYIPACTTHISSCWNIRIQTGTCQDVHSGTLSYCLVSSCPLLDIRQYTAVQGSEFGTMRYMAVP
jgi:hypothetical protein